MLRIAFIVSHPIQYYVPLYRKLAAHAGVEVRVFYTWHRGERGVMDRGFQRDVLWDIPLTDGYESEVAPNTARRPGTNHFMGLQNPSLVKKVLAWRPNVVHLTGYAYQSHLLALRSLRQRGVPTLFRGDSHLLDPQSPAKLWIKRRLLQTVFRWPSAFLCVGKANRAYYEAFGVESSKLYPCTHSIDFDRFSEPHATLEVEARAWRRELAIADDRVVLLFAGKFEEKKRPVALMRAVQGLHDRRLMLVMAGDGHLGAEVRNIAASDPDRFRILPFQNQTRMPLVYRLGDIFTLPSAYGETWGLAVNEAMACGRPALVSDRVGCAADVVEAGVNGFVFPADDWATARHLLQSCLNQPHRLATMSSAARKTAERFTISVTADQLLDAVAATLARA